MAEALKGGVVQQITKAIIRAQMGILGFGTALLGGMNRSLVG
jgi:hypothetical protein